MRLWAASAGRKNVAKRLRAKEGGGREEENRPEISASLRGRLRNRKQVEDWRRSDAPSSVVMRGNRCELIGI
jgi:hypothetical protein